MGIYTQAVMMLWPVAGIRDEPLPLVLRENLGYICSIVIITGELIQKLLKNNCKLGNLDT